MLIERENVVLRSEPATNSKALSTVEPDSEAFILQEQNGWYRLRIGGVNEGWVPQWYLANPELPSDQNLAAHILVNTPIYTATDETSEVITTVSSGMYLFVHYESNGWLQVTFEGQYGFIPTRLVNLVAADTVLNNQDEESEIVYDRAALEEQRLQADPVAVVRTDELPLLNAADLNSDVIYYATDQEAFALVETVEDAEGNEFYFVEDSEGMRGYLDSTSVGLEAYSIGHVDRPSASSLEEAVIMIDPGHGGEDPGAISQDQVTLEKNATLDTALILKEKLESQGATVLLTRDNDEFIELDQRSELSNIEGVDVFISLHYDGFYDLSWSGTSTYFYHESDRLLGQSVNEQLGTLTLNNFGLIFGDFHVLRENTRPSILLELGYMSNENDIGYLRNSTYHEQVAEAITQGLTNYFERIPVN